MADRMAAAKAIEDFLRALGHEPTGELEGTGERVADAWIDDLLEGEASDATTVLRKGSFLADPNGAGLVVLRNLSVTTMCPHHLLPAHGSGLLIYMPGDRVVGVGTLAQVLDVLSRRLTLQERIGTDFVTLLVREAGARGALCKLALEHCCMIARGERKTGAVVETLAVAGTFASPSSDRDLAFAALAQTGL